jgi:DNA polymerase III epsilon subunit-like protein
MTAPITKEVYISVDIEAAGPIPGEYSMLSIGACEAYRPENAFSCLLKPTSQNAVPEALAVTGFELADLDVRGEAPVDAMATFASWIANSCGTGTPVFVGLNAPFDWSFINYYFVRYHGSNPFGIGALDIKALFMGARGCSWKETRSSNMKRVTGAVSEGTHDALQDARFQAELFRLIRG